MNNIIKKPQAFTLMEIMTVIIILGILAGYAIPNYNKAIKKGYEKRMTNALMSIYAANESYKQQAKDDPATYWLYGGAVNNPIDVTVGDINNNLGLNIIADSNIAFMYICNNNNSSGYLMEAKYKDGSNDSFSLQLWGSDTFPLRNVPVNTTTSNLNPCCKDNHCPTIPICDISITPYS